ncbi:MAG: hypothetical protein ABEL97_00795 [Salinibacter sp.]
MVRRPKLYGLVLGLMLVWSGMAVPLRAQNNALTDRSFVSSPMVRGMGDAGVAVPGPEHIFFYNPAHLPHTASHFTVFGLQAGATRSLDDHIRFLNQEAARAVREGDALSAAARARLRRSAAALRERPSRGSGDILLPSFVHSPGAFGVGGGVFTKTAVTYRLLGGTGEGRSPWMLSRTDVMAVLSMGVDLRVLGLPGLSVGGTGTQTRRYLAFKSKPLTQFRADEPAVLLEGEVFQLDVGATYTPPGLSALPGTVRVGGAVYDVLHADYGYTSGGVGRLPFLSDLVTRPAPDSAEVSRGEIRRARRLFSLRPSYRLGAAYQLPALLFLEDVALAVDYQGYRGQNRRLVERLHLGARATIAGPLSVRAGLNSGYPTGGLGVEWGALHLDYALHGAGAGRGPDRAAAYVHTARLLVRLE